MYGCKGHLNVLEWAEAHHLPLNNINGKYCESIAAAENGHVHVLDYLHKKLENALDSIKQSKAII
jgi:hypothetical protein